jgi:hypothetical protein
VISILKGLKGKEKEILIVHGDDSLEGTWSGFELYEALVSLFCLMTFLTQECLEVLKRQ